MEKEENSKLEFGSYNESSFKITLISIICTIPCSFLIKEAGFLLKNFFINSNSFALDFLKKLQNLNVYTEVKNNDLFIKSLGTCSLFEPKQEIEIKTEVELFAFCGLFANLDYTVFFTSKTFTSNFSSLVLALYDAGVRFNYNKNFTFPLQIKGTSNLMPMVHTLLTENYNLALLFVLSGLSGIGKTKLILPNGAKFESIFTKILTDVKADFKKNILEDGAIEFLLTLKKEQILETIEIDLLTYETI